MVVLVYYVLPTVRGGDGQIARLPYGFDEDHVIRVFCADGVVEHVVVVPLGFSGGPARLVEQVVARDVRVALEMFGDQSPQLRGLGAVRLASRAVLVKVGEPGVAAVVAAVLRADRPVHVEYGVQAVFFAHLKRPVQPRERVRAQRELIGREQLAAVRKVVVEVHVGEGYADDVESEFLYAGEVRLRDPVVLIGGDESFRVFASEARVQRHGSGQRVVLVGGTHPAFLHQPAAEIGAAERDFRAAFVHYILPGSGEHGERGRVRAVVVVACGKGEQRGKRDEQSRKNEREFFHIILLVLILFPRRPGVKRESYARITRIIRLFV